MADRIVKPDTGNDLVLQNDDASESTTRFLQVAHGDACNKKKRKKTVLHNRKKVQIN